MSQATNDKTEFANRRWHSFVFTMTSPWPTASREDPLLPLSYTTRDLDAEEAEGAVLSQIESRGTNAEPANDDEERMYRAMNPPPRQSLKSVARRVVLMNSVAHAMNEKKAEKDGLMLNPVSEEEDNLLDHSALHPENVENSSTHSARKGRWQRAKDCCNHFPLLTVLFQGLQFALVAWVASPLAMIAFVLYYYADDPDLDFLPGEATLSWWLNFAARLCVTLGMACFTQYIFIDCIFLATGIAGPLVTLLFLQAKGWPFLLAMWSWLNLLLLQGDNCFQCHWLYWTKYDIYTTDSGDYVLESGVYLRLLLSGLIAGWLTAAKRTVVALFFGGQQLKSYQPRLEKLLAETVIMSEVGTLASKAEKHDSKTKISTKTGLPGMPRVDFSATKVVFSDDENDSSKELAGSQYKQPPGRSSVLGIKDRLAGWKEPVDKRDKV